MNDLDMLLREADVVSLHCPLTESTRDMIGIDQLKMMKPIAFLINAARGETHRRNGVGQSIARWSDCRRRSG